MIVQHPGGVNTLWIEIKSNLKFSRTCCDPTKVLPGTWYPQWWMLKCVYSERFPSLSDFKIIDADFLMMTLGNAIKLI